ncbi:MAG: arylsulfatase A-like enzyme [Pseudohongiellaceae bacterium]
MRVLPTQLRWLSLALIGLLSACAPEPEPPSSHLVPLRLLDQLDDDGQQRPFDPTDEQSISAAAPLILQLEIDVLANEQAVWSGAKQVQTLFPAVANTTGSHALQGAGPDKRLVISGSLLMAREFPVGDTGPLLVRVQADNRGWLVLIPVRRGQPPIELTDLTRLYALADADQLILRPASDPNTPWLQALVPADPQRTGLILGVLSQGPTTEVGRLEARSATPLTAALLEGTLRPSAEHIQLDGEAREAIVLPHGGSTRWTLDLTAGPTELTIDLGHLGAPGAAHLDYKLFDVSGEISAGRIALEQPPELAAQPWHSIAVELPKARHNETTLTFSADAPGAAIVVGRPTIRWIQPPKKPLQPDVILISLDTLRADRINPGTEATPRLQALARESRKFTDASSTSAWTLPAHTSLFTGRWAQAHGVTDRSRKLVERETATLARAFRDAGYETTAITGGGYVSPTFGLAGGFERYDIHDPCLFAVDLKTRQVIQPHGSRQSLLDLLSGPRERPLFAFVHTFAAHHGLPVDAKLKKIGLQNEDFRSIRAEVFHLLAAQRAGQPTAAIEPQLIKNVNAVYDAAVMTADDMIGDIVATLKAAGRWDNTILIVTSDHGQELFERTTVGHGHQLHPELLRIPLLIRAPGAPSGEDSTPVSLVDLSPTLRELAGLPADHDGHGRSLVPLLFGKTLLSRPILSHLDNSEIPGTHVYRQELLTLHLRENPDGLPAPFALYDLSNDPQELHNLLDERRALADDMAAEFLKALPLLRAQVGGNTNDVTLDDDTRRQLEELGYLTGR